MSISLAIGLVFLLVNRSIFHIKKPTHVFIFMNRLVNLMIERSHYDLLLIFYGLS